MGLMGNVHDTEREARNLRGLDVRFTGMQEHQSAQEVNKKGALERRTPQSGNKA